MAYSKAYQTVVAGRVREDEAIGFFKNNSIATPARVSTITNRSARKQPVIDTDHLRHTGIGKTGTVSDNKSAYNPAALTVS
jgi:hypothetical protein